MHTDRDFYAYTVKEAVYSVGGYENLASILGVALSDVLAWGQGRGRPPSAALFRIIGLMGEPRQS